MPQRALLRRLERVERKQEQMLRDQSRLSLDCICFPETEHPFFTFGYEQDMAFQVKCPLHGDRFVPRYHIFVAGWLIEKQELLRQTLSPQFQKAWAASFPPDLWPAEEEETDTGVYLRLKDGTRLLELPRKKV